MNVVCNSMTARAADDFNNWTSFQQFKYCCSLNISVCVKVRKSTWTTVYTVVNVLLRNVMHWRVYCCYLLAAFMHCVTLRYTESLWTLNKWNRMCYRRSFSCRSCSTCVIQCSSWATLGPARRWSGSHCSGPTRTWRRSRLRSTWIRKLWPTTNCSAS